MTSTEPIFAEFYKNYGVTDNKLRQALAKAAEPIKDALTYDDLERLWYSKEISGLRHGIEPKEERRKQADARAAALAAEASEESGNG